MLKLLRATLLASVLTISLASPARAEPISAAIAAVSSFAASSALGGFIVSTGLSLLTNVGASLLGNIFNPVSKPKPSLAMRLSVAVGGVLAQSFLVGDWATAGSMNYRGSWGTAEGTPNAFYVEERVLSDLPMPELIGFWYGEQRGTILWGELHPELGWPIAEARRNGVDHLWVKYRDGNQASADPYLLARFGNHATRPYLPDMIGRGRAIAIVTRKVPNEDNRDVFPANLDYKFETSGIPLYDLSQDSSAGGFGPQRWDDKSTWRPSGNTAVQVYNILRGLYWGNEWVYGLQGLHPNRLPVSAWIAAIAECNVAMPLAAGGSEAQFRTGAEISVDMEPAGVIEKLLNGCSGRIAEIGGIYKPLVGAPGAAVYSYSDADIVVTKDQGHAPFPRIEATYNGVRPKYVEPGLGWELKDGPPRYSASQEAQDGNQRLPADITFETVHSVTRVQRLSKAVAEEQRRWRKHREGLAPIASELEPLDVVSKTSAENGYVNKKFLITDIDDEPTYLQVVDLQELDPADYDYDAGTEERPVSVGGLGYVRPPPQVAVAWGVTDIVIPDSEGRPRRPGVRFTWDGEIEDVRTLAYQLRNRLGPEPDRRLVVSDSTDGVAAGVLDVAAAGIIGGARLEARIRYIARSARATDWSGWLPVDIREIGTSVHDLDEDMGKLVGLLDGEGSLIERFNLLRDQIIQTSDAGIETAIEGQRHRLELAAETDAVRAYFLNQVTVLVSADQALSEALTLFQAQYADNAAFVGTALSALTTASYANAQAITEVAAEVGGVTANGFFKMQASVAPAGWDVSIAAMLRASAGGNLYESGWYSFIKSNGQTGTAIKGNAFYLLTDNGGIVTSPFSVVGGVVYMTNVRISGDLVVDGTINTGKVVANAITYADLMVDNSISSYTYSTGDWQTVLSWTVNTSDGGDVLFDALATMWSSTGGGVMDLRLVRAGVAVQSIQMRMGSGKEQVMLTHIAAGNATWLLQVRVDDGGNGYTFSVGPKSLKYLVRKR